MQNLSRNQPIQTRSGRPEGGEMTLRAMRFVGALALLAVGAVHLDQYVNGYKAIPTIGVLFLLNAIGSGVVAAALLLPIERKLAGRRADVAVGVLAVSAVAIAAGSLIALFISESGSLFGFSESGYRSAIVVAIVAEVVTVLMLGPLAAIKMIRASSGSRRPGRDRARTSRSWSDRRTTA